MALGTVSSGTQASTLDTEHSLATSTTAGIYVCMWNLTNMVKSDVTRCFVKTKVLTGDTAEIIFEGIYANDLSASPIVQSPPVVSMFSIDMLVEQTDGTARSYPWSLIRVAEY